jgi:GABA permease
MYMMIAVSELRVRRTIEREEPSQLKLKMWFFPHLTIAVIVVYGIVLLTMVFNADQRVQLLASLVSLVVVLIAYTQRKRSGRVPVDADLDEMA